MKRGQKSGKISAQLHTILCIQFLDREKNDKTIDCLRENRFVFMAVWKFYQKKQHI